MTMVSQRRGAALLLTSVMGPGEALAPGSACGGWERRTLPSQLPGQGGALLGATPLLLLPWGV